MTYAMYLKKNIFAVFTIPCCFMFCQSWSILSFSVNLSAWDLLLLEEIISAVFSSCSFISPVSFLPASLAISGIHKTYIFAIAVNEHSTEYERRQQLVAPSVWQSVPLWQFTSIRLRWANGFENCINNFGFTFLYLNKENMYRPLDKQHAIDNSQLDNKISSSTTEPLWNYDTGRSHLTAMRIFMTLNVCYWQSLLVCQQSIPLWYKYLEAITLTVVY